MVGREGQYPSLSQLPLGVDLFYYRPMVGMTGLEPAYLLLVRQALLHLSYTPMVGADGVEPPQLESHRFTVC